MQTARRPAASPVIPRLPAALAIAALLAGCAGPAIRSQSPEVAALLGMESDIRLVSDYAAPWGTHPQRIERAALVTGLANTGSDPPPGAQRAMLMADMQARGVAEPNKLLASPTTSLVWVHAWLPPGVRKGDHFDVMVEVPTDNETTSLAGGWLMETRLAEMAVLGNRVRDRGAAAGRSGVGRHARLQVARPGASTGGGRVALDEADRPDHQSGAPLRGALEAHR